MKRLFSIAAVLMVVSNCLAQEAQIGLEVEADHLVVRNYSGSTVLLKGAMLNDRTDCFLLPATRIADGAVMLMSPQTLQASHAAGDITISLDPYSLRVGEGVAIALDHSPCVEGTSRAIRIQVVFADEEFGSYVNFPIPLDFSRP